MSVVFSQGEVDSWSRERDRHHQPTGLPAVSCKYPIVNASFWRQNILLVSIYNKSTDHEMTNLPSSYIKTVCTKFYCASLRLTFAYFALPAGQDEADDPLQSNNMLSPPVLWCNTLYPDEWEEADLGLSCLRQEGAVWAPFYRWVRRAFVTLQRYAGMIIFRPFIFLNGSFVFSPDCSWKSWTAVLTVMKSSSKKTETGPPWGQRRRCRRCLLLSTA